MVDLPQNPAPGYPDQAVPGTFQSLVATLFNGVQVLSKLVTATQAIAPSATPTLQSILLNRGAAGQTALGYYGEGLWTPVLLLGGANVSMTFATQTGIFTRIGRQVFCSFQIVLTAKGASTGSATISGLPFAANANAIGSGGAIPTYANLASITETPIIAVNAGASAINLLTFGAAASASLTDASFTNTSSIQGYFSYNV